MLNRNHTEDFKSIGVLYRDNNYTRRLTLERLDIQQKILECYEYERGQI